MTHEHPQGAEQGLAGHLCRPGSFGVFLQLRPHYQSDPAPEAEIRSRIAGCVRGGLLRGCFISEPPPGRDGHSAEQLASWVLEHGGEPVVSLSLAAQDREQALRRVRAWCASGVRSLLAVTGDWPPGARPAEGFDIDSLQALTLLGEERRRDAGIPGELNLGCVVSPFKRLEAELRWQYLRLRRKIAAGADFVTVQAGYDPRAWDEVVRYLRVENLQRPVIGTVILPDETLARRIAAGRLPGVSIPPRLLERLAAPGASGLRVAAAAVAVLRGLGYSGALLGGRPLSPEEVGFVVAEAERLAPNWREQLGEFGDAPPRFAWFRRDEGTGLNEDRPAELPGRVWHRPMYGLSYAIDHVLFGPVEPVFRALSRVCRFCDTRPLGNRALLLLEWLSKAPLYGCTLCGDCTLYACGFYCSESGCPKRMVNGPCGGSRDGRCEVDGRGACLWVKVYDRLKSRVVSPDFTAAPVPPKDRRLAGTSSWINYCLGRDHRRLPVDADPP